MTTDRAKAAPPGEPAELPSPISRALTAAALLLLVVSVTGRTMIGELPFRTAPLQPARMVAAGSPTLLPDTLEPARATFALLLLVALACGLGGQAALRRRPPWRPWLGGIAAFGVWATVSGLGGIDARAGLITAAEQTALLAAGYLAALLARDRQLRGLLLATLAAAGAAVAVRGLWQAYGESGIQRLETFQAYRTKAAELPNLIARLTEAAPWGFLGLANLFAALLVVLLAAATAIAAGKIARARARAASFAQTKGRAGEIDLAWVAAGLSALLAGVLAWVLWLTESRGAIAAAGIAAAAGVAVGLAGQRATRHRRGLLIAAGAAVLTAIAAVTAMGLARDGLPGKSMTFRWFYWTGAAEIIADRPLLGTGGGGFGPAYLAVRRPEAEEAVKNPHNWPLHAAGQFGIPGGLLFAAMVIGVLVTATRPGAPEPGGDRTGNETGAKAGAKTAAADAHARPTALFGASLGFATAAALLVRWWDIHAFGDPALWMLESAIPAGAVAIGFLAACWCGGSWNPAALLAGRWGRIAVAAGLWAFAIHGLVSFGFWAPGVATAFWALAGVAVGGAAKPASARRGRDAPSAAALARTSAGGRVWRWLPAAAALAAAVAADLAVTAPAWRRYAAASEAAHEWAGRDWRRGLGALARAAEADPLDPTLPAEAARLHMATAPGLFAEYSLDLADEAVQRAPQEAWYHCLRAQCLWWLDEGPHLWTAPAPVAPLQVLRRQLASTPPGGRGSQDATGRGRSEHSPPRRRLAAGLVPRPPRTGIGRNAQSDRPRPRRPGDVLRRPPGPGCRRRPGLDPRRAGRGLAYRRPCRAGPAAMAPGQRRIRQRCRPGHRIHGRLRSTGPDGHAPPAETGRDAPVHWPAPAGPAAPPGRDEGAAGDGSLRPAVSTAQRRTAVPVGAEPPGAAGGLGRCPDPTPRLGPHATRTIAQPGVGCHGRAGPGRSGFVSPRWGTYREAGRRSPRRAGYVGS